MHSQLDESTGQQASYDTTSIMSPQDDGSSVDWLQSAKGDISASRNDTPSAPTHSSQTVVAHQSVIGVMPSNQAQPTILEPLHGANDLPGSTTSHTPNHAFESPEQVQHSPATGVLDQAPLSEATGGQLASAGAAQTPGNLTVTEHGALPKADINEEPIPSSNPNHGGIPLGPMNAVPTQRGSTVSLGDTTLGSGNPDVSTHHHEHAPVTESQAAANYGNQAPEWSNSGPMRYPGGPMGNKVIIAAPAPRPERTGLSKFFHSLCLCFE